MGETLAAFSNALAEVVENARSSVVRVEARRRLPASGIVFSETGMIVTAYHVIERDENIPKGLEGGKTVEASLIGRDPTTDLAFLDAPDLNLSPPEWAVMNEHRAGHLVLALGRPGQSVRTTLGVVSALGGVWRTPAGGQIDQYLQTDVVMYPGFSGGPLVNAQGLVIGLNTSALLRGISLTVPVDTLRRIGKEICEHGRVRRGFLGVGTHAVRLPEALSRELGQETGLLLASVEAGSAADKGGLLLGDTLISFEGQPLRDVDDLLVALSGDRIGKEVTIGILRGGEALELKVSVGEKE